MKHSILIISITALVLEIALSACSAIQTATLSPPAPTGDTGGEPTTFPVVPSVTATAANPLAGTHWNLVSYGAPGQEKPVISGSQIMLVFEGDSRAGGTTGCNSYSSPYQVQGETITFGEITSNLIACADQDVGAQEVAFLQALASAERFEHGEGRLAIFSSGGLVNNFEAVEDESAWVRAEFGDAWDISYPLGWSVNQLGAHEGAVSLNGMIADQRYIVSLSFPIGQFPESLAEWAEKEVAGQPEDTRAVQVTDAQAAGVPAVIIQFEQGGANFFHVYLDKSAQQNRRLVVMQPAEGFRGDPVVMRLFLERFLKEMRAPAGS